MASWPITFCQWLPSAISEACIIITSAPTALTLAFLIWKSTGIAFSSSVFVQPPAPKLFGAADHHQAAAELLGVADEHRDLLVAEVGGFLVVASSPPLARGTLASTTQSKPCNSARLVNSRSLGITSTSMFFSPQPLDQELELARVLPIFDQQHAPLAADVREGGGRVVLRHARRLSGRPGRTRPGRCSRPARRSCAANVKTFLPGLSVDRLSPSPSSSSWLP